MASTEFEAIVPALVREAVEGTMLRQARRVAIALVIGIPLAVGLTVVLVGLLQVGVYAVVGLLSLEQPDYDTVHPDYAHYSAEFERARSADDSVILGAGIAIDLGPLNGGDWSIACLFGGYADPVRDMRGFGAVIAPADAKRLVRVGMRVSPVEEYEAVIGYVDADGNQAHFVHFPDGLGGYGQHFRACVRKPETIVVVAEKPPPEFPLLPTREPSTRSPANP